jgi:hypothetical protein
MRATRCRVNNSFWQSGHSAESCAASIHQLLVSPPCGRQPEFPLEHPAEYFARFSWKSAIQQFGDQYRRYRQHAAMLVLFPGCKFGGPNDADV